MLIVSISTGDMGPLAMIAFWVAIGGTAIACLIGALCLIFPKVHDFVTGIRF